MVMEAADRLLEDSRPSGRMMSLGLHPWVIGQPQRIRYLDQILTHLRGMKELWFATAGEIADCYRSQVPPPAMKP
jgi:hypothetical protein